MLVLLVHSSFHFTVSIDDRINEIGGHHCSDQTSGQDDLPGSDLISRFKLDDMSFEFPGVKRVRGSNRIQTAYRMSRRADLSAPTRYLSLLYYTAERILT